MPDLNATIPHQLSRQEAKRRIEQQVGSLRQQPGAMIANLEGTWHGDTMAFAVSAMGQSMPGQLTVDDQAVHISVTLPWLLRMLGATLKSKIEQQGRLLLADKR